MVARVDVSVSTQRGLNMRAWLAGGMGVILLLALVKLLMHLFTNGQYGYHRDELYYIACGMHPDLGYVDHPPLTPMLAAFARWLFGNSLAGLRMFPALAGACVVLLTGLIARELGGGRFAQGLAALCALSSPLYFGANSLFQTVSFDLLAWVACSYLLVRLLKTGDARLWLPVGLVLGIGLLAKYTVAFFIIGLVVGLLLTPNRAFLRTPWLWLGGLLALVLFMPNLLWEAAHGWPSLEFLRNNNADVRSDTPLPVFLLLQIVLLNPFALPVWVAGLRYFFSAAGKQYRLLGWIYVAVLLLLAVLGGKPYYVGPAYPMLMAGGALAIERFITQRGHMWLRPAVVGAVIVGGLVPLVTVLPVLPRDLLLRYHVYEFNKDTAEMFGWPELVGTVAGAYNSLSPQEQHLASILTMNYGEAGAVDFYGGVYNLPPATSAHNSYYLWGPRPADVVIAVGFRKERLDNFFSDVRLAGTVTNNEGVHNDEYNRPIYICRQPKAPMSSIWPQLKRYN